MTRRTLVQLCPLPSVGKRQILTVPTSSHLLHTHTSFFLRYFPLQLVCFILCLLDWLDPCTRSPFAFDNRETHLGDPIDIPIALCINLWSFARIFFPHIKPTFVYLTGWIPVWLCPLLLKGGGYILTVPSPLLNRRAGSRTRGHGCLTFGTGLLTATACALQKNVSPKIGFAQIESKM